jgi:type II secretory ATPase GspE/PulE/Tfp pilus assembly ATPase PilB-like protein
MSNSLLAAIEYSGYISVIKLVIFLILFLPWVSLFSWVYKDAEEAGIKKIYWTAIVFTTGAAAIIIWLIVPIFIVGLILYLLAVSTAAIAYIRYRNSQVLEYERILTVDHIKGLLSPGKTSKLDEFKNFVFVTANNNTVPMPGPKTSEFYGYKTTYDILKDATWRRASDIIFVPAHQNYSVAYYVDGVAIRQPSIEIEQARHFIHFIKLLAGLDIEERRKPKKGKFAVRKGKEDVEWELLTSGSTVGEQLRLKKKIKQGVNTLSDINLTPEQYQQLNKLRDLKQGLFIVSGPRKSGMTTTFYALLRNHDAFMNSIETLEKEPSADLQNITQKVFSLSDTGTTTYAKKLLGQIRMGPDIVGVAGCDDDETAKIACEAAKDKNLIYVTLEADNVIQALDKWRKLVGDDDLAIDTLLGISNQRLLRKLCDKCKQSYAPNQDIIRKFNLPAEKTTMFYRDGKVQYDKHNKPIPCENCQGTGFVGRMAIFELILIDEDLRKTIKQTKSSSEISAQFRRAKMRYLQEEALKNVIDGTTAVNEMIRVISGSKPKKTTNK